MIEQIFATITSAISQFATSLGGAVTNVAKLFYDPTANSGAGEMTFLGTLLLIAVGIGVVYWVFGLIRGLVARRAA